MLTPTPRNLFSDDPYGIRTRVTAVKGRCLNHLTNGPYLVMESKGFEPLRQLITAYMISNHAPSASSDNSPNIKVLFLFLTKELRQ